MRDYSKVAPSFWTGDTGRQLREMGRDAQLVALYLITGPSANMIGIYHLPMPLVCHHTGLSTEGALEALRRGCEAGFCRLDPQSEDVFVPMMAFHQIGSILVPKDLRHKGLVRQLEQYRKSPFFKQFHAIYSEPYNLPKLASKRSSKEAPCKPLRSQEQEQEQEQEINTSAANAAFEEFWKAYPRHRRQAKGKALKAWKTATRKVTAEDLLSALKEYAASPVGRGEYVKAPASWLNGECWADDRTAWSKGDGKTVAPAAPVDLAQRVRDEDEATLRKTT